MRLALHGVRDLSDEQARYVRQLGITDVNLNQHWQSIPGDVLGYDDLCRLKQKIERHGLSVPVLENVPLSFYDKIMLGKPGREAQMERLQQTIRNIGRAGIPIFGFHFMPTGVWRTNRPLRGPNDPPDTEPFDYRRAAPDFGVPQYETPRVARGGAAVSTFDYGLVADVPPILGRVVSEEELWENFTWFIRHVMPVAEEVGLKISMHPDDPVVPMLAGMAHPFRSFEAFRRATEIANSPLFGVTFCLGNWTLMGMDEVRKGLDWFGPRGLIHYLHFQAVRGTPQRFEETFFDESEVFYEVLKTLKALKFDGVLVPAHAPVMGRSRGPFEDPWAQDLQGLTHGIGFLQGLLHALERGA
ncbi:MAG: mannonate dehydratase [Devosia sp.]